MTDAFYSGGWEGYYIYGKGYPTERRKIKVGFFLKMFVNNGALKGTIEEYLTKVHMRKPAKLWGSIDGDKISFIKQYPYYYEIGDTSDRTVTVDKSMIGPSVRYTGVFDPVTNTFNGNWELKVPLGKKLDEGPGIFGGSWGMRKV